MKYDNSNHMWMMALGCGGAVVLIFILPLIGLSKNWSIGIAVFAMIGCHIWMMKEHSDYTHK